jgi:hypothetical protein
MSAEKYAEWLVNNADKRGTPEFDTVAEAYKAARAEPEQAKQDQPTLRQKVQSSAPMRVLQGIRDPIDAAAQLLPRGLEFASSAGGLAPNPVSRFFGEEAQRVDEGIAQNERAYQQARLSTGQQGADIARFGGNVVSPANLAVAARLPVATSLTGRAAQGFGLGAVGGGLQPVNTEENPDFAATKAGQMALGGATGAVATPIMGAIGDRLARFVSGKLQSVKGPNVTRINQITEEFARSSGIDWDSMGAAQRAELQQQVFDAAKQYVGKDPKVASRIADFKRLDMPYTLGQVTRDPMQFATEKNLTQLPGTGDPLRERFMQQGAQMQRRIGAFASGAQEDQPAGNQLVQALRNYDEKLSSNVSAAYRKARESAGKDAEVPMQGLAQDFADVLDRFGDKVPSGVRNNFAKYGLGADAQGMNQRKLFTVEEADKLLKVINANQSNDPAVNASLSELRNAVKKAIVQDAGVVDVFSPARSAASQRFKLQEAIPALEASASGTVNPDTFVQNFILSKSAQTAQVKQMANVLAQNNPEAFLQAKSQIGAYLQRKAFGENLTGDKPFSPDRFQAAIREIGTEKLGAFYTPDEISQLQRIARVGSYMESVPFASKPNVSGNWGAITSMATNFPGTPQSAALVNALRNSVGNQMNVNKALSAEIPRQLSAQEIRLLSRALSAGAVTSGIAGAEPLK